MTKIMTLKEKYPQVTNESIYEYVELFIGKQSYTELHNDNYTIGIITKISNLCQKHKIQFYRDMPFELFEECVDQELLKIIKKK